MTFRVGYIFSVCLDFRVIEETTFNGCGGHDELLLARGLSEIVRAAVEPCLLKIVALNHINIVFAHNGFATHVQHNAIVHVALRRIAVSRHLFFL